MHRSDFIVALVLMAFGALVAIESWRMPRFENVGGTIANAPGLVPGLLGVVIAAFGAVMAIRAATSAPAAPTEGDEASAAPETADRTVGQRDAGRARFGWMLGLSLLYAGFLIGRIDFALATFLFVFVSVVAFERPMFRDAKDGAVRVAVAAVIAVGVGLAIPFVFERIFLVTLP